MIRVHDPAKRAAPSGAHADHGDRRRRRSDAGDPGRGPHHGLLTESAKRTEGVGADVMVQPPSASVFMAFSGAPMPISIANKLEQLNYVQAVAPVLVQFNSVNGLDIVYGIDPDSFRAVSGGFVFLRRARS